MSLFGNPFSLCGGPINFDGAFGIPPSLFNLHRVTATENEIAAAHARLRQQEICEELRRGCRPSPGVKVVRNESIDAPPKQLPPAP